MVAAKKNISLSLVLSRLSSNFLARFQATTNGKITSFLAMKEKKWKGTVDAISKTTHSSLI